MAGWRPNGGSGLNDNAKPTIKHWRMRICQRHYYYVGRLAACFF